MASGRQITGMRGVYLVAAELAKRGFIVSPTSRSAIGADLLVTDQACRKSFSVQVKTNQTTHAFWLVGHKAKTAVSPSHVYVLVNIHDGKAGGETEYYVLPSRVLARRMYAEGNWPSIKRRDVLRYKDRWSIFGNSS